MAGKRWNQSEIQLAKEMLKNKDNCYIEIAEVLGRTHGAVKCKMASLGIKVGKGYRVRTSDGRYRTNNPKHREWSEREIQTALDMLKNPENTCIEIGIKLGRTRNAVQTKLSKLGISVRYRDK